MDGFFNWFFAFITEMFQGLWQCIQNIGLGFVKIFNIPEYIDLVVKYSDQFNTVDWIVTVVAFLLVYAFWLVLFGLLVLVITKYIRFRKSLAGNEDLLEEISSLHREINRLTTEKERLLELKLGVAGMSMDEIENAINGGKLPAEEGEEEEGASTPKTDAQKAAAQQQTGSRFVRLTSVDQKYEYYVPPIYDTSMNLKELCDDLRNFACYRSKLYYEIKTIRLMVAGFASTKMVILQGISGTGKTSLPYIMGKYFTNDITIASVQLSWRDRAELFGFFNEFTKKFNETEVLKRIYDSGYNDNINIVLLDEMNIARVEYYFAEMLSILEMPDPEEWKIEIVPSSWDTDPRHLVEGQLKIPQNVWYVGTANNDDSTFTISDKVYDRAFTINLDNKGIAFEPEATEAKNVPYSHVAKLYLEAQQQYKIGQETLDKIEKLDTYVIEHFRVAFGNRIAKQIKLFVPVYIACGGTEYEGLDYILATKILRKFESLNLGLIRDEIKGLINYLDQMFGKGVMVECIAYLRRLQKMY